LARYLHTKREGEFLMTAILNASLVHSAPRPLDAAGAQTKATAVHTAEAPYVQGANGYVTDDATVRPRLYDALQSILADANRAQTDNAAFAAGQIRDSGAADDIISMAKSQILSQSGPSALGPANKDAQAVLSLLK
jgi:hypothetical protein